MRTEKTASAFMVTEQKSVNAKKMEQNKYECPNNKGYSHTYYLDVRSRKITETEKEMKHEATWTCTCGAIHKEVRMEEKDVD